MLQRNFISGSMGKYDADGGLLPGVYGHQPELAEHYINVGSLYLCSAVFLPLGLPGEDVSPLIMP